MLGMELQRDIKKFWRERPLKGINVNYFLSNLLISFVILGYSYVFKLILNKNKVL